MHKTYHFWHEVSFLHLTKYNEQYLQDLHQPRLQFHLLYNLLLPFKIPSLFLQCALNLKFDIRSSKTDYSFWSGSVHACHFCAL